MQQNGYQGVFAWELSGDTDNYELLDAMQTKNNFLHWVIYDKNILYIQFFS